MTHGAVLVKDVLARRRAARRQGRGHRSAPQRVRDAAAALERAELAMMERDDEPTQLSYAKALADWGDAGGYDAEVLWDACCVAALGTSYDQTRWRDVKTLSTGH